MRALMAATIVAAGFVASAGPADACSIRGRWCGYPLWAANAFESWGGRVNPASEPNVGVEPDRRHYDHARRARTQKRSSESR